VDYEINLAETDVNLSNNTTTSNNFNFTVSDSIYARDDGNLTEISGVAGGGRNKYGLSYDFSSPVSISAIQGYFELVHVSIPIAGHIYSTNTDGQPDVLIASTDIVDNASPGTPPPFFYTLPFPTDVDLPPGEYVFAVEPQIEPIFFLMYSSLNVYTPEAIWLELSSGWVSGLSTQAVYSIRPIVSGVGVVDVEEPEDYVKSLNIHPNPGKGVFNVQIELNETKPLQIDVFDVLGKLITTNNIGQTQGGQYTIDLSDMNTGIYFVKLRIDEQLITKRILISQ